MKGEVLSASTRVFEPDDRANLQRPVERTNVTSTIKGFDQPDPAQVVDNSESVLFLGSQFRSEDPLSSGLATHGST